MRNPTRIGLVLSLALIPGPAFADRGTGVVEAHAASVDGAYYSGGERVVYVRRYNAECRKPDANQKRCAEYKRRMGDFSGQKGTFLLAAAGTALGAAALGVGIAALAKPSSPGDGLSATLVAQAQQRQAEAATEREKNLQRQFENQLASQQQMQIAAENDRQNRALAASLLQPK